ncbi:hypothetical protein HMI56_000698 [Coelomomyces lativittatus]|nr:hypothetical protein HMI56_000698 [Coelomomyces lativittatus]
MVIYNQTTGIFKELISFDNRIKTGSTEVDETVIIKDILVEAAGYSNKDTDDDDVVIETVTSASDALQTLHVFITTLPDNSVTGAFAKKV